MENILYLVALNYIGISQQKLNTIFRDNENYKEIFEKIDLDFLNEIKVPKRFIEAILEKKSKINLSFLESKLKERNVKIITIKDSFYPKLLKEINNYPYFLYVRGKLDNSQRISVVGSRAITSYGKKAIEKIIPGLSKYFTIVSGGAFGCDSEAHLQTLKLGNKTIVVIGTGIDIDYPAGNKAMYDKIVEIGGAIISIFPIGEPGNPYNFPIRNEIVAGLSVGTIVIEAKEESGSLITASLTLDLGRDLFAVAGDIFRATSKGCNDLIKKGEAKLISSSEDILEEYNICGTKEKKQDPKNIKFNDKIEEEIYNLLLLESLNSNEIMKKLEIDISELNIKLSIMEISQIIKKGFGGKYEII